MDILRLPVGRFAPAERAAMRRGLATAGAVQPSLKVVGTGAVRSSFCARCAAPIDFGAVWRGHEVFCSVECSLGGNPA